MRQPAVSALIDTYNQGQFIEQAIESVLAQDLPPSELEIIVVDDGSTDNTASIVQKFGPRIKYLRKQNGGQASALNAAVPQATAPVVAFLDADDWWAPGKVHAILEAFERNPGIATVGHGFFEVKGDASVDGYVVPERVCRLDLAGAEPMCNVLSGRIFLGTSKLAVRREVLQKIGPIPEELVFCADTPILTLAFALGGAILLDKPLCYYRLHSENLFEFEAGDTAKTRRRSEIARCHLRILPPRLVALGVPPETVAAFFAPERLELERFRLSREKASRLDTFRTERKAFEVNYKNVSAGYKVFKWLVAFATLLMPPRQYYKLRSWYGRTRLSSVRSLIGDAELVKSQTFIQRRKILA